MSDIVADPVVPPTDAPPAVVPPVAEPAPQDNAANAQKRITDKLTKERDDALAEIKRRDTEALTETERVKQEAAEAKAEAATAKAELLRTRIARETGLSDEAMEFLSGTDEETLRASAEKLVALTGKTEAAPARGGTTTNPARNQAPTNLERADAALKAKNPTESIRLKREHAGLTS